VRTRFDAAIVVPEDAFFASLTNIVVDDCKFIYYEIDPDDFMSYGLDLELLLLLCLLTFIFTECV